MQFSALVSTSASRLVLACASAIGVSISVQAQTLWYVTDTGTGSGSSWANAASFDTALQNAQSGDELHLQEGVYIPQVRTAPSDPRSVTFEIKRKTTIRGGYLGTEIGFVRPTGTADLTILDGEFGGNLSVCDDNAYHVVSVATTEQVILHGCRITRGCAASTGPLGSPPQNYGGGIYCEAYSKLDLAKVFFLENNAAQRGGGMYANNSTVKLRQCLLQYNGAARGGGIFSGFSALDIVSCYFLNNGDPGGGIDGGALYLRSGATRVINGVFWANEAPSGSGGAGYLIGGATVTWTNCSFFENNTVNPLNGPAIANAGGTSVIENSILWGHVGTGFPLTGAHSATFSDIQGPTNFPGAGNINQDPMFVAGSTGDLRLQAMPGFPPQVSPCIDQGSNALVPNDFNDIDYDGNTSEQTPLDCGGVGVTCGLPPVFCTANARIIDNPLAGAGLVVDMGAYETP